MVTMFFNDGVKTSSLILQMNATYQQSFDVHYIFLTRTDFLEYI